MIVRRLITPIGELTLTASDAALTGIYFPGSQVAPPAGHDGPSEILDRACDQLAEYFAGKRITFDVPLGASGTEFEHRVWNLLSTIPYGSTTSYGALAQRLGDPSQARAVGAANGKNPIPIIVPCHRVIGAHGDLTGFGGGIERKRWLLQHEGVLLI